MADAHLAKMVNSALYQLTGSPGNFTPWNIGDVPADDIDDLLGLVQKHAFYQDLEAEKDKP